MKIYEMDVRVFGCSIRDWFYRQESVRGHLRVAHEIVFSIREKEEALENMCYFLIGGSYFKLPPENLIILGLKHAGLLNCPRVQGYYLKAWGEYECVVTVKIECLADEDCEEDDKNANVIRVGYSKRERDIKKRIQKFFAPTAIVDTEYRVNRSVGYGD